MITIRISDDFSLYPAGRDENDGPNNGARFRDKILVPKIRLAEKTGDRVKVILDGARSYGSSFLEEAFGGLVREHGIAGGRLRSILEIEAKDPVYHTYKRQIDGYLKDAARARV